MSTQYLYRCAECGYTVQTDDHGCECTMSGISYLYHCQDCGMLAQLWQEHNFFNVADDSQVKCHWWIPGKGSRAFNNCCPCCGSKSIHRWNPVDNLCPECGGAMIRDNSLIIQTD